MMSIMNERQARLYASEKAMEMGRGGIVTMAKITGLSERTIRRGIQELRRGQLTHLEGKARRPGGGRKRIEESNSELLEALESVLSGPEAPAENPLLHWTDKSLRVISEELAAAGHAASPNSVRRLLIALGYWRHEGTLKRDSCTAFDPAAQCRYLHRLVKRAVRKKQPVFSIGIGYRSHSSSVEGDLSERVGNSRNAAERGLLQNNGGVSLDCDAIVSEWRVKPHCVFDCVLGMVSCWWHSCGQPNLAPANQLLVCLEFIPDPQQLCELQAIFGHWAIQHNLKITISHLPHGLYRWSSVSSQLVMQHQLLETPDSIATLQVTLRVIGTPPEVSPLLPHAQPEARPSSGKRLGCRNLSSHKTFPKWNYTLEAKCPSS